MRKAQQIEYINNVFTRFENARNHGFQGNNWWYPRPFVIAYNVKLHCLSKDADDMREKMTGRQKEYYSNESLYGFIQQYIEDQAEMFVSDLEAEEKVSCCFSGRSGGWLEIEYAKELHEVDKDSEDISEMYKLAKSLEEKEARIAERIKKEHAELMKYLSGDSFVEDMVENRLLDDESIANVYRSQAREILEKLK